MARQHRICLFIAPLIALILLTLSGCMRTKPAMPVTTYLLSAPTTQSPDKTTKLPGLKLNGTDIAPSYASTFITYRMNKTVYQRDYYHRFLDAPSAMFNQLLYQSLQNTRAFNYLVSPEQAKVTPFSLSVHVEEFYADYQNPKTPKAILAMSIRLEQTLPNGDSHVIASKHYQATAAIKQPNTPALINAWNQDLAQILPKLLGDVAHKIKEQITLKSNHHAQRTLRDEWL